jgi:hypothetical protein
MFRPHHKIPLKKTAKPGCATEQDVEQQDFILFKYGILDTFGVADSLPAAKNNSSGLCPDNNSIFIIISFV